MQLRSTNIYKIYKCLCKPPSKSQVWVTKLHPFLLNIGQELQESHNDSFSPLADAAEVLAAEAMAEAVEKIKAGTAEVFIVFVGDSWWWKSQ